MNKQMLWMVGGVLCALLTLTGCHLTSGAEATGKTAWTEDGALTLQKNVVFNNPFLSKDIEIVDASSARSGDLMTAQVNLRSKTDSTLNVQYKFEWYDQNGMALYASSASWKPLLIYGREGKVVQGVAPDPRGREFKLLLRQAD